MIHVYLMAIMRASEEYKLVQGVMWCAIRYIYAILPIKSLMRSTARHDHFQFVAFCDQARIIIVMWLFTNESMFQSHQSLLSPYSSIITHRGA